MSNNNSQEATIAIINSIYTPCNIVGEATDVQHEEPNTYLLLALYSKLVMQL